MAKQKSLWRAALLGAALAAAGAAGTAVAETARQVTVQQAPLAAVAAPASGLTLDSWIDRSDGLYLPGERLELYLRLNRDARVTVWNVAASGQATMLFPNEHVSDSLLAGNRVHRIPADARYHLQVGPPFGTNLIKVIATTAQVPLVDRQSLARSGAFDSYRGTPEELARQLQVVVAAQPQAAWAMAEQVFEIAPQRPGPAQPVVAPIQLGAAPATPQPQPLLPAESAFGLEMRLGQESYRLGESLALSLAAEKSCHLTLLNVDAAGSPTVLYPNSLQREVRLRAGQVTFLPGADSDIRLQLAGTPGPNSLIALCTEERSLFAELFEFDHSGGRSVYPTIAGGPGLAEILAAATADGRRVARARADYLVTP